MRLSKESIKKVARYNRNIYCGRQIIRLSKDIERRVRRGDSWYMFELGKVLPATTVIGTLASMGYTHVSVINDYWVNVDLTK